MGGSLTASHFEMTECLFMPDQAQQQQQNHSADNGGDDGIDDQMGRLVPGR